MILLLTDEEKTVRIALEAARKIPALQSAAEAGLAAMAKANADAQKKAVERYGLRASPGPERLRRLFPLGTDRPLGREFDR